MNNRSYALVLCAAFAVSLTARVDARSIDTGVWRGDHGSFTIEKAYSMLRQSLGKDQTNIVAVAYIDARRTKSERHYYRVGTNYGASRDAKGAEPRLVGFNVWEDGRVDVHDEVDPAWKKVVTKEADCGALFAELKRLNVDIKSVDRVSRDAHSKENVLDEIRLMSVPFPCGFLVTRNPPSGIMAA